MYDLVLRQERCAGYPLAVIDAIARGGRPTEREEVQLLRNSPACFVLTPQYCRHRRRRRAMLQQVLRIVRSEFSQKPPLNRPGALQQCNRTVGVLKVVITLHITQLHFAIYRSTHLLARHFRPRILVIKDNGNRTIRISTLAFLTPKR